jgi:hypothetical protein
MLAEMVQDSRRIHGRLPKRLGYCDAGAFMERNSDVQLFLGDNDDIKRIFETIHRATIIHYAVLTRCAALLEQRATRSQSSGRSVAWNCGSRKELANRDEGTDLDWKALLDYIADPVRGQTDGLRSWLWRTARNLDLYQTCEASELSVWSRLSSIEQDLQNGRHAGVNPAQKSSPIFKRPSTTDWTAFGWKSDPVGQRRGPRGLNSPRKRPASRSTRLTMVGASAPLLDARCQICRMVPPFHAREIIYQTVMDWLEETGDDDDGLTTLVPARDNPIHVPLYPVESTCDISN